MNSQVIGAESDQQLRDIFSEDSAASVLLETGYRRPLEGLTVADKTEITRGGSKGGAWGGKAPPKKKNFFSHNFRFTTL